MRENLKIQYKKKMVEYNKDLIKYQLSLSLMPMAQRLQVLEANM